MLIDTHCHLNLKSKFPHPADAVKKAFDAGVEKLIVVGIDAETSELAVKLADQFPGVWATVGWHPTSTANFNATWLDPIRALVTHPRVVAVGEIGLDYHWPDSPPADQERALLAQLDLAEAFAKPVVYHSREAYPSLLEILERRPYPHPQVLHCFAGDEAIAMRAVKLGHYFGVDGPVTYKNAEALRALLPKLPKDRIVIETDSPFLAPAPFRGKPNEPALITYVAQGVADALGLSLSETAALTTANAKRLFGLP